VALLDEPWLRLPSLPEDEVVPLLTTRARLCLAVGDVVGASRVVQVLREHAGASRLTWLGLDGMCAALRGQHDRAAARLWEQAALAREDGSADLEARAFSNLGMVYLDAGRLADARGALTLAHALAPEGLTARHLRPNLAALALCEGDVEAARSLFTQAIEGAEGDLWTIGAALAARAGVAALAGDAEAAWTDIGAARSALADGTHPRTQAAVEVWAGLADLAGPEQGTAATRASARLEAAALPDETGASLLQVDIGARLAACLLARARCRPVPDGPPVPRLGITGEELYLDGAPIQGLPAAALRIARALAVAAAEHPGRGGADQRGMARRTHRRGRRAEPAVRRPPRAARRGISTVPRHPAGRLPPRGRRGGSGRLIPVRERPLGARGQNETVPVAQALRSPPYEHSP
jgi:Flp pilus assembly protein TadD